MPNPKKMAKKPESGPDFEEQIISQQIFVKMEQPHRHCYFTVFMHRDIDLILLGRKECKSFVVENTRNVTSLTLRLFSLSRTVMEMMEGREEGNKIRESAGEDEGGML